jgi:hypothetical protein
MLLLKLQLGHWQSAKDTSVAKIKYWQGEFNMQYLIRKEFPPHGNMFNIAFYKHPAFYPFPGSWGKKRAGFV